MLKDQTLKDAAKGECSKELKGLKVKKNLGSVLESVGNFSKNGYTISYSQGDICQSAGHNGPVLFSSEVRYICNSSSDQLGWPEVLEVVDHCHFKFEWASKWACPVCRHPQIKRVAGSCIEGQRSFAYLPNDNCLILEEKETNPLLTHYELPPLYKTQSELFFFNTTLIATCNA